MNKIDFIAIVEAKDCNPNGNPNDGNRPRTKYNGKATITNVCVKRKIRNQLQVMGENILLQSVGSEEDEHRSIYSRLSGQNGYKEAAEGGFDSLAEFACNNWIDIRAFGQVFAIPKKANGSALSGGVRGCVTINPAESVCPVIVIDDKITKSLNTVDEEKGKKGSDTMGDSFRLEHAVFVVSGSINARLAEKNGFTEQDADLIKEAIWNLFENDVSSARPAGSMAVRHLYWVEHNKKDGQYPSGQMFNCVKVTSSSERPDKWEDYEITASFPADLNVEVRSW